MKKVIYLIRHAKAMDREDFKGKDDSFRPLTPKGISEFEETLKRSKKKTKIKTSFHSPFLRCAQTARLIEKTYKIKSQPLLDLSHGTDVSTLLKHLFACPDQSAFIGHEPELSELCLLLGLKGKLFKKGEIRKISIKLKAVQNT